MAGDGDKEGSGAASRLADAVRAVKNRAADRDGVVVELREASRARLDLLAAELAPVFAEVPDEVELFDFAISSGLQPRLWIDAVAHVDLGRDRRTYRFLRDTRFGPVLIAEGAAVAPIADAVTAYVAERLVERERALEDVRPAGALPPAETPAPAAPVRAARGLASSLGVLALGALAGLGLAVAFFWERLVP